MPPPIENNKILNFIKCGGNTKLKKPAKYGLGMFGTMIFGILFGWAIFPKVLHSQISREMSLKRGTDMREMWRKIPFALDFKVYVFNCTNPDEVMKGGKPRVQEVGPYYYELWKEKVNFEEFEDEDTMYYNRRDVFLFKKEKSGPGLTGNEIVTIAHPILVAIAVMTALDKPTMLNVIGKANDAIFDNPKSIFMPIRVADLLFDGINMNCDHTDFAPKAVCSVLKKHKAMVNFGNNQIKFSLFGLRNATVETAKFKVLRGIKNIMDVGKVVEYNNEKSQNVWGGPDCNDFNGTDGTIFPPFLTEKDDLISFSPEICRSLGATYEKKSSYVGIATNRYVADLGDIAADPKLHCFCDTPTTCPMKGLMDITKCYNAPFVASMPHFLKADPAVQQTVEGLAPDIEKHGINIDFEPLSGTPLQAKKRLQFNLLVMKIDKLETFKNFPERQLIPYLWIEEGLALNKTFTNMLKYQLFFVIRAVNVLKWLLFTVGLVGTMVSTAILYKTKLTKFVVGPATSQQIQVPANGHPHNNVENDKKLTINTIQSSQGIA